MCRRLSNTALEQRKIAEERCGVALSCHGQDAELKDIRAEMPEDTAMHSHVLQDLHDVLARLDKALQAFLRRSRAGQPAGSPRFHGRTRYTRYTRFTSQAVGNGARLEKGFLVRSSIGRIAVRWSRPLEGTPKTVTVSREADGWCVGCACADVPPSPLPPTGQETGRDLGLEAFATTSDGPRIVPPGWYRKAERRLKTAPRRVSRRKQGSHRSRKAVGLLAKAHLT